jgi:GNAT superfamily N-acetyltransferase
MITRIDGALPADFELLRAASVAEGHTHIDRLVREWREGRERFDVDAALLIARVDGALAGVGGVTRDPIVAEAYRMRRFYVDARFRRRGVARALAEALLAWIPADRSARVTVNAGTVDAPAFWQALGFTRVDPRGGTHTHERRAPTRSR